MVSKELKQSAVKLRDLGHSYKFIEKELGIRRSTLSGWFRDKPFNPNQYTLDKIRNGPKISAERRISKRIKSTTDIWNKARTDLGKLSQRDLFMLGLGLYLGEGTKGYQTLRIVNADGNIIKLAVKWFKDIFGLQEENFSLRVHAYPDTNLKIVEQFWLKATELPDSCIRRTIIDKRQKVSAKKGKLPFGTAHLTILAAGNQKNGVQLFRLIQGYMKAVSET